VETTAREIEERGRRSLRIVSDVKDRSSLQSVLNACLENFGQVDILMYVSGVCKGMPFLETDEKLWDWTLDTNLKGAFLVASAVTRHMVKRRKGFNTATRDWEFFELDVSKDGTQVRKRGFADVVNRFGGNCFGCHIAARPEWDLVCETDHGCAPIPLTRAMSGALQRTDPRCNNPPVSVQDTEALKRLNELLKPR